MNTIETDLNRRSFFKHALVAVAALLVGPRLGLGRKALAADKPLLSPSDTMAKSLFYVTDAAKADKKLMEAKGAPAAQQKCSTCMLYGKIDEKHGTCQIFPNNTVLAGAWCNSWTKKA